MLRFIGTGSAFNTALGNTSAWLRHEGEMVLIDCGGSVFGRLLEKKLLAGVTRLDICLTHTHGDHVGSLGDLLLYSWLILGVAPTVRHPEPARIIRLIELLGVPPEAYALDGSELFSVGGWLKGRFEHQVHADTMPAFGLELALPGQQLWYSGDSRGIPAGVLARFLKGEITCLYQDTTGMERPDSLHLSLSELAALIPPPMRSRVVCMHLDESFDPVQAEAMGFHWASAE